METRNTGLHHLKYWWLLQLPLAALLSVASADAQQFTTNTLPPGLISWWEAEGNALDSAGTNDLQSDGNLSFGPGRFEEAFQFDGVFASAVQPGPAPLLNDWTQVTLEAWISLDTTNDVAGGPSGRAIISRVGNPLNHADNHGYQFGIDHNSTNLFFQFNTNNQPWPGFRTVAPFPTPLVTGLWYHVVATYDHNAVILYVNAYPLITNVVGPATIAHSSSHFRISKDDNGNVPFPGRIDEVRVFNRGLSAGEVAYLFQGPTNGVVNVIQHHHHASRDGLYVDPAFTQAAAAKLLRDKRFDGTIVGNVYAQPLYVEGGPGSRGMVIVATEANSIYALDSSDGSIIWQQTVGVPVPQSSLGCGNINPLGITGTPVVDLPSRSLFFDAMTTPDGGATKSHLVYSLNVDSGIINPGWPARVNGTTSGTNAFVSAAQNQRGALAIFNNTLYLPYGGHYGGCGTYYGWLVSLAINDPTHPHGWSTTSLWGGSWAVGGVATDGINPFIATGNEFPGASSWRGGQAIIRFQVGPLFSALTNDFWATPNWATYDNSAVDIGSSGVLPVDLPGPGLSKLLVAMGGDGNAYLLNRTNLGGISAPLAQAHVSSQPIVQAPATYRTANGTYVTFRASSTQVSAFRITPGNPPAITPAWTVSQSGLGSPFVTSTDGSNNMVVWLVGAEGDQRLHGYDGDSGSVVYSGGGANELMTGTRRYSTGIAARGRIYLANDNKVYAFTVPVPPIVLTNLDYRPSGAFQFTFTNIQGLNFTAYSTTNLSTTNGLVPLTNWTRLGRASEIAPGKFQFNDPPKTDRSTHFFIIRSP